MKGAKAKLDLVERWVRLEAVNSLLDVLVTLSERMYRRYDGERDADSWRRGVRA